MAKGKITAEEYSAQVNGRIDYMAIQRALADELSRQGIQPDDPVLAIVGVGATLGLFAKTIDLVAGNSASEEALQSMFRVAQQAYRSGKITN